MHLIAVIVNVYNGMKRIILVQPQIGAVPNQHSFASFCDLICFVEKTASALMVILFLLVLHLDGIKNLISISQIGMLHCAHIDASK